MASQTCHNLCVCAYLMAIRVFQGGQCEESQSVLHGECGMSRRIAGTSKRDWKRRSRSVSPRSGFTVIELLVSISVMGIFRGYPKIQKPPQTALATGVARGGRYLKGADFWAGGAKRLSMRWMALHWMRAAEDAVVRS